IAAQILAILSEAALVVAQPAFVVANLAAIFTDITVEKAVVSVESALVEPARALGHFIRAHGLEPVDSIGQFLAMDPLFGPAADNLAQAITEGRVTREITEVLQNLTDVGARSQ